MVDYQHEALSLGIKITGSPDEMASIKKRRDEAFKAIGLALNQSLYSGISGEAYVPRRLTWREKLQRRIERIQDAWLVLTGRADIE